MAENSTYEGSILRQKAEAFLKQTLINVSPDLSESEVLAIMHEWKAYPLAFEKENEGLLAAKNKAEATAENYIELYDLSVSPNFTLSVLGEIMGLNPSGAKLLGKELSQALNTLFSDFVSDGSKPAFSLFLDQVFSSKAPVSCELALLQSGNGSTQVNLTGIVADKSGLCQVTLVDVSARKQAEDALLKSGERFHAVTQSANDGIITIDAKGIIHGWNRGAERIFGYTEEDIFGKELSLIIPKHYAPKHNANIERVLNGGEHHVLDRTVELYGLHKSGNEFPVELSLSQWKSDSGVFFTGIIRDITQRKLAEATLKSSEIRLKNIIAGTNAGTWEWNIQTGETVFNERWAEIIGYSLAEISPVSIETWIRNTHPDDLKTSGELLERHFDGELNYYECEARMRHKNGEWVWVLDRGKVISWSEDGKPLLMSGIHMDITNQKLALSELRENEVQYRALANSGSALIWRSGTDKLCNYFNEIWLRFTGRSLAQEMGNGWTEGVHRDDLDRCVHTYVEAFGKHEAFEMEYRLRHASGEYRWLLDMGTPNFDSAGEFIGYIGHCFDISERKQSQEELRKTNAYLENLINHSNSPIIVWDSRNRITRFNHAFESLTGLGEAEVLGQSLEMVFPPSVFENSMGLIRKTITGERWETVELEIRHRDQSIRTVLWNSATLFQPDGRTPIATIAQGHDISRRKTAEEELRKSEEKYRFIAENTSDGIILFDAKNNVQYVSPTYVKQLGYEEAEEMVRNPESIYSIIHPDDRDLLFNDIFEAIRLKESGLIYSYRAKHQSGHYIWREDNAKFLYDGQGNYKGAVSICRDITEIKRRDQNLKDVNSRLTMLIEAIPDAISFKDGEGHWLMTNELAKSLYKLHDCNWIGKTDEQLGEECPGFRSAHLSSGKGDEKAWNSGRLILDAEAIEDEQGQVHQYEVRKVPLFEANGNRKALVSIGSDVTRRLQAESELRKLSHAVEQSPVSIVITNPMGDIEYVNPQFTMVTGYSFDEVKGKNSRFLQSGGQGKAFYEELWKTIESGQVWHGEFHNKKKNGDSYWESASISTIVDNLGNISFYIAVKEDVTDKKKMMEDLIQAKEQAEESDRLKSAFLANMSHEIRTPMNGILGFTSLLKEPNLTGEQQQLYIGIIKKSGARMLNIINDIISISKVESGQMEVSVSETNINEQIEFIYSFFKPEAEQKHIKLFHKNLLPEAYAVIKTDREKVYAILTNLVKNAIKFTPAGTIEFGYVQKGDCFEFYVKDTGVGVPEDKKTVIFERFRQGSELNTRNYEGAGLGLSISKAYVEMLGGKIWVESELGKGAAFYFTIPCNMAIERKPELSLADLSEDTAKQGEGLKILIADDDETSVFFITTALNGITRQVLYAQNGNEAVETCRDNPDIDIVLMDIKMPGSGGYEATREIRRFDKKMVIIAQTAFGLYGDREKAIQSGCTDYISKPIDVAKLKDLIFKYQKKRRS